MCWINHSILVQAISNNLDRHGGFQHRCLAVVRVFFVLLVARLSGKLYGVGIICAHSLNRIQGGPIWRLHLRCPLLSKHGPRSVRSCASRWAPWVWLRWFNLLGWPSYAVNYYVYISYKNIQGAVCGPSDPFELSGLFVFSCFNLYIQVYIYIYLSLSLSLSVSLLCGASIFACSHFSCPSMKALERWVVNYESRHGHHCRARLCQYCSWIWLGSLLLVCGQF